MKQYHFLHVNLYVKDIEMFDVSVFQLTSKNLLNDHFSFLGIERYKVVYDPK